MYPAAWKVKNDTPGISKTPNCGTICELNIKKNNNVKLTVKQIANGNLRLNRDALRFLSRSVQLLAEYTVRIVNVITDMANTPPTNQ